MKDFNQLLQTIEQVHQHLQRRAANSVNRVLTIRNWLIGYYIVEYEFQGKDRANYGEALIDTLAKKLGSIKGVDRRSLFRFRSFYLTYPHLSDYLINTGILNELGQEFALSKIVGTVTPQSQESPIVGTVSPQSEDTLKVPPEIIITKLSYSHIELILNIDDQLKRLQ